MRPYIKLAKRLIRMRTGGRDYPQWFWDLRRLSEKMLMWGCE
ncbi:MAG: hypothetical protein R2941_24350 [Desulfobacterales bacterium]